MSSETNEVAVLAAENGEVGEMGEGRSRRDLLKAVGVAAAGVVVGGVLSPKESEASHGDFNVTSNTTRPAIHGDNTVSGDGVYGSSSSGRGVFGHSTVGDGVEGLASGDGFGVRGNSFGNGAGVRGRSPDGRGVQGISISGNGVQGESDSGRGVQGTSNSDAAVHGSSQNGPGVLGVSTFGTGVIAAGGLGDALNVFGRARFDTGGAGNIPAGQKSVTVNDAWVTAQSHITMTLTGNPGSTGSGLPAVVVWVQRQPGTGFTAHLSRQVANATPFTYLIVEPT